ncbi:MAG TPA: hypothetical protein VEC57_14415 [Candidatus Limnocylindrales bacterium]|nr:hypothetical protein [Candidatus Limnocylindrales bacterium]
MRNAEAVAQQFDPAARPAPTHEASTRTTKDGFSKNAGRAVLTSSGAVARGCRRRGQSSRNGRGERRSAANGAKGCQKEEHGVELGGIPSLEPPVRRLVIFCGRRRAAYNDVNNTTPVAPQEEPCAAMAAKISRGNEPRLR